MRGDLDARMGWYIVLGTIPISILGLAFKDPIETQFRNLELIGTTLIVFGFVMLAAEAVSQRDRPLREITARDGLLIGLRAGARARAGREPLGRDDLRRPVPATSTGRRRRATRSCCRCRRSCCRACSSCATPARATCRSAATALATLLAFVTGYLSIAFLLRYLARHTIAVFVAYRVVLGVHRDRAGRERDDH